MHLFNGYDIELTKGDSLFFKINLDGRNLPEGSVGYFTVKSNTRASENVIRKKMDASDGVLDIRLTSEDTDIPVRTYVWDVRVLIPLEEGGYEVETPMEYATLTILDAIGAPGDDGEPPGMDADLPILSLLVAEAREAIDNLNAYVSADRIVEVLGYTPAPIVVVSNDGAAITDAIGGKAKSVVATLNPLLDSGAIAPSAEGGSFVPWRDGTLIANGTEITAQIPGEPYIGSYDWVSGKTDIVGVSVVKSDELELTGAQGTTSQGIKYVRFRKPNSSALANTLASNRYAIIPDGQADKAIRLVASGQLYLYDNDIDLDNPEAILVGLELLISTNTNESYYGSGNEIVLNEGNNTITSDSGAVTVEYGVDTKTYIDQKFAALSAALLGG